MRYIDYGNTINAGQGYVVGNFMEKIVESKKGLTYKLSKKQTFFFKEPVIYPYVPYVPFTECKKG